MDWTAVSSRTAAGNLGGVTATVTSNVSMNGPSQSECGTNYWTQPRAWSLPYTGGSISNAPTACEQIALDQPVTVTVTFSAPVERLYMAIVSAGQPGLAVTYDFDRRFRVDSSGVGYWSGANGWQPGGYTLLAGDKIAMKEFHGVLEFTGPLTSLTFSTTPGEYWHGFTLGVPDDPAGACDLYLRPLSIEYDQVAIGTSLKKGFTLTNASTAPLPINTSNCVASIDRSTCCRAFADRH